MCASFSSVCAVMYAVVALAVTVALFVPPLPVMPVKPSRKQLRVEDSKKREHMMLMFEDWWVSGKSTPRLGPLLISHS